MRQGGAIALRSSTAMPRRAQPKHAALVLLLAGFMWSLSGWLVRKTFLRDRPRSIRWNLWESEYVKDIMTIFFGDELSETTHEGR